jgi:YggT family protein
MLDQTYRTPIVHELLSFIDYLLWLYMVVLIIAAMLSWLVAFDVINTRHPFVRSLMQFVYLLTEPLLRPIRGLIPSTGGIDLAFLVLFLFILFIRWVIIPNLQRAFP